MKLVSTAPFVDQRPGTSDPNLVHAKHLYDLAMGANAPDLCAASDGDPNLIIGRGCFVTPSDSLAAIPRFTGHNQPSVIT